MSNKVHPFEMSGLGLAPFSFVGVWTQPSIPDGSSHTGQIETYNLDMKSKPDCCKYFCAHCGTAIMVHCIIENSEGVRYAVGQDCIAKYDSEGCADETLIAVKQRERELRRIRKIKKDKKDREIWLAKVDANNESNEDRINREQSEREQERVDAKLAVLNKWGFLVDALRNSGSFGIELANSIENGQEPYGRGGDIALEIFAKQAGRKNSKAYADAYDDAYNKIIN
jgi:hypothetical protein